MARDAGYPRRLDRGQTAPVQPRRLDELGRHQPAPGLLAQVRAGVAPELDAAGAQVPLVFFALAAQVAQQPGQHGQVDLLVAGRQRVQPPAVFGHHGVQLRVDVAPLAHAAHADEAVAQALFLLAVGELVDRGAAAVGMAATFFDPVPQLQVTEELALLVIEFLVPLVGGLRLLLRPVAHVLPAQRGGDDEHLAQRLAVAGFEDHAAHARVQRQLAQLAAHGRQLVGLVDGVQLVQQRVTVGDGLPGRRFEERKVLHRTEVQRLHAQDHAGQRRTQDFRVGEARPAGEITLVVQADADAVGHPPAAPGALVGRRLADGLDLQLLDLAAVAVALHACQAGVDDVADARHGERGLGDVGGQHDAPAVAGFEDAVLLGLGKPCKQGQDFCLRATTMGLREVLAQVVGRLANFSLAGQEDEDVARRMPPQLVHRVGDGVFQTEVAPLFEGPPALFDREQAPRHHDHRRRAAHRFEVPRKAVGVDGGRGDDDLQVGPARQQLAQVTEQEVDVQAALVRLVDDQRVVAAQQRVALGFGEQDAVGHQLHRRPGLDAVLEAHLVAHHLAQRRVQFLRDALGHAAGRNAPRLGMADQARATRADAAPEFEQDLRELRGLARTGFAADDDHRVVADRARNLVPPAGDRQGFGIVDGRDGLRRGGASGR